MSVRRTNSQKQILSLLKQLQGEINAQDLYVKLHERGEKLRLATVSRGLKALKLEGIIQEKVTPRGESFYSSIRRFQQKPLNYVSYRRSFSLNTCSIKPKLVELCQGENFKVFLCVNIEKMAEGPVYKELEDPKIYRSQDLFLLGVLARGRRCY